MSDDKKRFQEILKNTVKHEPVPKNNYWFMKDNEIMDSDNNKVFTPYSDYWYIFRTVRDYFKQTYFDLKTEAQVLIFTETDYQKLKYLVLPELKLPVQYKNDFRCVVPPQINTASSTSIPEKWWYENITKNNIYPLMRIHSHHVLPAYQSKTDYYNLNSGTLEVVLGKIYDETPEIEYWLDIKGTNNKAITFHKP